jgi:sugar phosphate isomerase/epimerase
MQRRNFLLTTAAAGLAATGVPSLAAAKQPSMGLGFSLYGMRNMPIAAACRLCGEIGYDCVELPVLAGWPTDSATLQREQIAELRASLEKHPLRLSSLMENLSLVVDDAAQAKNLARLRSAVQLAKQLDRKSVPLIETVLGGRPADWPAQREAMQARLADWAEVVAEEQGTLAIKAHVSGAAHLPAHLLALLEKVKSPAAVMVAFDPSHFLLRGQTPIAAWRELAGVVSFVHVKDAAGTAEKPAFLLPGEGKIDFVALVEALAQSGYSGDVVVEVSAQISSRGGYNAEDAARRSYDTLSEAFAKAGVARR